VESRTVVKSKKGVLIRFVLWLLGTLLVLGVLAMLGVKYLYDSQFPRFDVPEYSGYLTYDDLAGYKREIVTFQSGTNTLTGYIYGQEHSKGLVVIAHGLGGGAESYLAEAVFFVDRGWRVFSFDCTGSYASEGRSTRGLPQSALDLEAALTFIANDPELSRLPVMLFGHSWGGYAVTAVLQENSDVRAAVSIAGFNSPIAMLLEQGKHLIGSSIYLAYPFAWAYQTILFGEVANRTAVSGINSTDAAVMIIHGTEDASILYDGSSIIAQRENITNPKVTYKTMAEPKRNGHNNLLYSIEALEYVTEKNKLYRALYEQYEGSIPDEVKREYYAGVDRRKTSELNLELMEEINSFFEENL
jgi:pimeloyl-ACP methyl ester carboxylesterase